MQHCIESVNSMNHQKNEARIGEASRRFLDVIDQPGIHPLIRVASEFFGVPVLLTDEQFRIRSVWPREGTGIVELDESIRGGTIKAEREWEILDENLSGVNAFYEPFYASTGICARLPRIYGELVWQNEVRGHVIVYLGRRPFQQDDLEIVRKLVNLLGLKLRRHQVGMDRWTATLQAKLEVLLDPSTPPQVRQPAVDLLKQEIKGEYGIMVTTIGARASQRAFADYAVSQIQQRFRNVVVLVYDEAIVTLFGEVRRNAVDSQLRPENNELVKWLFRYFGQYDLVSGLSDQFADLDTIYLRYRRALLTARMVERVEGQRYGIFRDFMPMPMLAAVLATETAETFIDPLLYEIRDYDEKNQTEYFQTLFRYAVELYDKDAAAAALAIHKNTLSYRLNRIAELFHVDFTDRRARLNLELSCFLWYLSNNPNRPTQEQEKER